MSWSVEQSRTLYHISAWSEGYVDINDQGQVCVLPDRSIPEIKVNLLELTQRLQNEGLTLPILVRFSDILKNRVNVLIDAFDKAMRIQNYDANYTSVYPIKVNQQRRVIEDIISAGDDRVGLEAGSKPELLINIALANKGSTLICNGYKDREYIRLALIAKQLGFKIYIVIEKLSELPLIIECANELGVKPLLGLRIRLLSIANGNWQNTGGEKSKFGLHANQVLEAIEILRDNDLLNSLELLHFHIGSQVAELNDFKKGLNEGARFYAQFKKMSIPINTVDIGGGLGIDYEGTQSTRYNSVNYTIDAYANAVVSTIQSVCKSENIDVPSIITESGRAMTAHHAMMITNIIDIEEPIGLQQNTINEDVRNNTIDQFYNLLEQCTANNITDCYKKNTTLYEAAREQFANGQINLQQWAWVDELYYAVCQKLLKLIDSEHDLLNELRDKLANKYFANFSIFQTMPDTWAIDQIFPILPLQRLNEKPDKRCTLQDLTCDSDGRIDKYVDGEGIETSLPIHSLSNTENYLIGIFLLGAYQEILGDIHNLFGDSASANIELSADGNYKLSELDTGDKVSDLFQTIHIDPDKFRQQYQSLIETCSCDEKTKASYLDQLIHGLEGYTYLED